MATDLDPAVVRRIRAALALPRRRPLDFWHFGVPRLKESAGLLTQGIDELALRACNKGTKTETLAALMLALNQKRPHLDGVALPQWKGPLTTRFFVLDYEQQQSSVQPAFMRLLGDWPHKAKYKGGDILASLRVKPMDEDLPEEQWSKITFLSQKNLQGDIGGRSDVDAFDEPPKRKVLEECRKAAHARRPGKRLIGFTPTIRSQWAPLLEMYGPTPRETIRRIGPTWAEVRWSLHEVADFVLPPDEKERLLVEYGRDRPQKSRDLLYDARVFGDYCDTSGACPFDVGVLHQLLELCKPPVMREFKVTREVDGDEGRTLAEIVVQVETWGDVRTERRYYIVIDSSEGINDPRFDPGGLHVVEIGTGNIVARFNGYTGGFGLGTLGAVLARHYNNAVVDPETQGGWGDAVLSGLREMGYGNIAKSKRELQPGKWHTDLGFKTTQSTRPAMIGAIQKWLSDWSIGIRYGACPSQAVLECLLDVIIDPNGKPVAAPGYHDEDMILRGQSLRRTVPPSRPKPQEQQPASRIDRLARIISGADKPAVAVPEPRRMPRM